MNLLRRTFSISRLKINLLASFAGTGWSTLMGLVFIPLYIRFMGIEAYGLVGFYIALQGALQILDFGLSPTMNREMARYSVQPEKAGEARDLVRTLEIGYWAIGLVIGAGMYALAPWVAARWLNAVTLPARAVETAVAIIAVLSALQWPLTFYQGGLLGLQRQAALNALLIAMSTLRNGGAALILWLVSPTVVAFFMWQIVVSALHVSLITFLLWRSLPRAPGAPRFQPSLLKNIWRFAAGMSGITLTALILTQLDKVILSKLLSLEMFGYYTLAATVGNGLAVIAVPVFNVVFPRLSAQAAEGDLAGMKHFYHRSAQTMAVVMLPIAAVIAFFAPDIFRLWTGSSEAALNAAPIASLLVVGTALNSLMVLPYALQLAHGWTSLGLRINLFLILGMIPAIFLLTARFGAVGAAFVWAAVNGMYLLCGAPLTYRRLLKGEGGRWLVEDVGLPLLGAVLTAWAGRVLLTRIGRLPPTGTLLGLAAVLVVALAAVVAVTPALRSWTFFQLARLWAIPHAASRPNPE
jgi:O-antigen/teichoic acid export membrane protein